MRRASANAFCQFLESTTLNAFRKESLTEWRVVTRAACA